MSGPSRAQELLDKGEEAIDENDWAAECQRRVVNGSDGMWMRFGAQKGEGCASECFAFRFNPCVSFFAVLLLGGLVAFCSIKPAKYCTQKTEVFQYTQGGVEYEAKRHDNQFQIPTPWDTRLTSLKGASGDFFANLTKGTQHSIITTIAGQVVTLPMNVAYKIEETECFMPKKEFDDWMKWVTRCFTWLYIITQDIWIVFLIYLYFSKYGDIKIGKDDDEPEFTYFEWFAMLFTCGVATGLFFFAVTEPQYYYLISHDNSGYSERNRWKFSGVYVDSNGTEHGVLNTPNARVQHAMTTTWYHWGLHGWVCYCILGLCLGFLHFRKGLPMTIKTCFYPLVGTRIYGLVGDLVDVVSVVATTMGVCTSLGLGVMQLNQGIELLNGDNNWLGKKFFNKFNVDEWRGDFDDLKKYWDNYDAPTKASKPWFDSSGNVNVGTASYVANINADNNQQILLIWIITAGATTSVMLGMKNGIKNLALFCMALGQFVVFYVWVMDDTWFLTNLFVQTIGHYIAELPTLGFYASAVEQSEVNNPYGEYSSWQYWWTIFYWGWWIAWAPFVGVFLARIGRGRTIREFIFCTLVVSCIYNFLFMTSLGGAGLKMQLLAEKYNVGTTTGGGCGPHTLVTDPSGNYITLKYKENICRQTSTKKYSGEKEYFCSTVTNLACSLNLSGTMPLFDVISQYSDVGKGLVAITCITIAFYFIASSDSGSMVDDMITANGLTEPCLVQRFFWAMTEGAAATALMSVGKYIGKSDGGLKALRAASICVGLPYTFLICLMCLSLLRALQFEKGDRKWTHHFRSCFLDVGITTYTCGEGPTRCFNLQAGKIDFGKLKRVLVNLACPVIPLLQISRKVADKKKQPSFKSMFMVLIVAIFFLAWFTLMFVDYAKVATTPVEYGSVQGDENDASGITRRYFSNRYGYYQEWGNHGDQRAIGDYIYYNKIPHNNKGQEKPVKGMVNGRETDVGMGDRMAHSMRIAAFGWFFLLNFFVMYIASLRSAVREICKFPGSLVEDYFVCCFWPLALTQLQDQMDYLDPPVEEAAPVVQKPVEGPVESGQLDEI